ncbi:hypothetical protein CDAR_508481 [Caerostris darwini]|uniref:Uncharacterized protein n=1 Tax=Caerostris darwini TaxID=1538125 RepID=A0AAV4N0W4_9ARAC|nr:hypothetical protein CDAR_508481 [Caerostris darwini]
MFAQVNLKCQIPNLVPNLEEGGSCTSVGNSRGCQATVLRSSQASARTRVPTRVNSMERALHLMGSADNSAPKTPESATFASLWPTERLCVAAAVLKGGSGRNHGDGRTRERPSPSVTLRDTIEMDFFSGSSVAEEKDGFYRQYVFRAPLHTIEISIAPPPCTSCSMGTMGDHRQNAAEKSKLFFCCRLYLLL